VPERPTDDSNPEDPAPENQGPVEEPGEAPAPDAGASPPVTVNINGLDEIVKETVATRETDPETRRDYVRIGLVIAFFVLFVLVFGVGALGALLSEKPWEHAFELVKCALPFVTGLGGYILGYYFPAQAPPPAQNSPPTGGGSGAEGSTG
jgi:hypothetical protein